jgi:tRNA(fMet)-specific endonuclease VapC
MARWFLEPFYTRPIIWNSEANAIERIFFGLAGGPVYLLDTNIVSYWIRGHQPLLERIKSHSPKDLSLSAITLAEIYYSIEKSRARKKERLTKIEQIRSMLETHPFDEPAAAKYGIIRVQLEKRGWW